MMNLFWVGLGGSIGSILRYLISVAVSSRWAGNFPYGTLAVNVMGSFLIGYFFSLAENRIQFSPPVFLFLTTGLLGGFTTFSAFGLETFDLLKEGRTLIALIYALFSLIFGVLAVYLGRSLG